MTDRDAPRNREWGTLSVLALAVVVLLGHLSLYPKVADLDAFYHLGHAAAYAERSIFDTSFPWTTVSVVGDRGGDLWWGFHLLLLPFTAVDVLPSVRVAALALTAVLAAAGIWVLGRHHVARAPLWVLALLLAVPNVFFLLLMARPHTLSLALGLVLAAVLARGRSWQAALCAGAISWTHLSLFWLAPGIALAHGIAFAAVRRGSAPQRGLATLRGSAMQNGGDRGEPDAAAPVPAGVALASVLLGTVVGALLRPQPLATLALAQVQIIQLFALKGTGQPLAFAAELLPLPPAELVRTAWLFLVVWGSTLWVTTHAALRGSLRALPPGPAVLLLTSILVSAAFLALTLVSARRAMLHWVAFGGVATALAWTHIGVPEPLRSRSAGRARAGTVLLGALLAIHLVWGAWRHTVNVARVAFRPDTMEGVAAFLEARARPGDLVFHARWDNFGPLFAHYRGVRYLSGMDPIFQFAHDPRLYWEYFYLSSDVNVEWTCDAFPCSAGTATDTHEVLRRHFGARWVVTEPARNPRLSLYLLHDPRYRLALETRHEAIFEVLEPPRPAQALRP